jgi:hypothetical protein
MLPTFTLGDKILQWLVHTDEESCRRVAAARCPHCGGPLHRGDYARKPRGGLLAAAAEVFTTRLSLCCGWPGCRRRSTPPSVRFLGRRVYLGVAVLMAGIVSRAVATPREVKRATGIPPRTVGRWRAWWQTGFPEGRLFQEQRGRFLPPLVIAELPASLVERFDRAGRDFAEALVRTLSFLAPLTTASVADGSRFVRVE